MVVTAIDQLSGGLGHVGDPGAGSARVRSGQAGPGVRQGGGAEGPAEPVRCSARAGRAGDGVACGRGEAGHAAGGSGCHRHPGRRGAAGPGLAVRVAGGLVGAITLSQVHLHALAQASFGVGIVSWVILGSVVLNRLMTAQRLPAALQPVTAIELAPPALAGVAWFALAARGTTVIAYAIGGYLVLMALVPIRLIPVYRKLRFSPGFWAFTFSYAIAITCALEWITRTNPPGATGYAIAAITAITVFIGAIAARSVTAIARGQFLAQPADGPPAPRTPAPGPLPARPAGSRHRHRLRPAPRAHPAASGRGRHR